MIENEIEVIELNSKKIESMIYYVRGQKVMLDFELAEIYGYETKSFNRQVKNNNDKFDEDFMFQLNKEEYECLMRSKKLTARMWIVGNKGGRTYLPYAFPNVFDSTFYWLGKTHYMLFESVITNVIYYGVCFILYITKLWTPSLLGIALMFGIGNAFDSIVSLGAYLYLIKKGIRNEE